MTVVSGQLLQMTMDPFNRVKWALSNLNFVEMYHERFVREHLTDEVVEHHLVSDKAAILFRVFTLYTEHWTEFIREFQRLERFANPRRQKTWNSTTTGVQQAKSSQLEIYRPSTSEPSDRSPVTVDQTQGGKKNRRIYTQEEVQSMLDYVCENNKYAEQGSMSMWEEAKRKGHFPTRTACGLFQQFKSRLNSDLKGFRLTEAQKSLLKQKRTFEPTKLIEKIYLQPD